MKQNLITLLLLLGAMTASAQLKVKSDGNVTIGSGSVMPAHSSLTICNGASLDTASAYSYGLYAAANTTGGFFNIGVRGLSKTINTGWARTFGVQGLAGNGVSGWNYGVFGGLIDSNNGAAVFGTTNSDHNGGIDVQGRWAGYFDGSTHVAGAFSALYMVNGSDARLKENIVPLNGRAGTLDRLLDMNVVEYDFKQVPDSMDNAAGEAVKRADDGHRHYGLIAQELQAICPELVYEYKDGYLGVNYVELVPLLIRSIQELKQQVDELRGADVRQTRADSSDDAEPSVSRPSPLNGSTGNILYQNAPNPFREKTTIRFHLADDSHDAAICIFDMTGKLLRKLPVNAGMESVTVNGWELGEGMFLYSLIVGGQETDTKRMIITK